MGVTEVKIKYKWNFGLPPIINISHCIINGFVKQYVFTINLFKNLFWIELDVASHLTTIKIGILSVYFVIGGGTNE
tara:strand:- start:10632 stop:10859 length:228 start_codon:yes stop_codon:yes gene_type:complete